jgi:hypothetical protein
MDGPQRQSNLSDGLAAPAAAGPSRRGFLLMSMSAALVGCAQKAATSSLPGPVWKARDLPPEPVPLPPTAAPALPIGPPGLLARSRWAGGDPAPALMDRMAAIQWLTVHHDGMDPFYSTDEASSKARLESIRRSHRGRGWGDVGYHYIIDRHGRLWEGRPINFQGAHVKDCNPGNIGVMCMGNFDKQPPSQAQLATLNRHVGWLMKHYRVQMSRVRTHQEWPSAATACPGVNLQRYMVAVRKSRQIGQA